MGLVCVCADALLRMRQLGRVRTFLCILVCGVVVTGLVVFFGEGGSILSIIDDIMNARGDSNATRENLYARSIELTFQSSPFIGLGIKEIEMGSSIPLGSHSTYVGVFYRVGIFGLLLFVSFVFLALRKVWAGRNYFVIVSMAGVIAFAAIEDIDGLNWVLFYTSLLIALSGYASTANLADYPGKGVLTNLPGISVLDSRPKIGESR